MNFFCKKSKNLNILKSYELFFIHFCNFSMGRILFRFCQFLASKKFIHKKIGELIHQFIMLEISIFKFLDLYRIWLINQSSTFDFIHFSCDLLQSNESLSSVHVQPRSIHLINSLKVVLVHSFAGLLLNFLV